MRRMSDRLISLLIIVRVRVRDVAGRLILSIV